MFFWPGRAPVFYGLSSGHTCRNPIVGARAPEKALGNQPPREWRETRLLAAPDRLRKPRSGAASRGESGERVFSGTLAPALEKQRPGRCWIAESNRKENLPGGKCLKREWAFDRLRHFPTGRFG